LTADDIKSVLEGPDRWKSHAVTLCRGATQQGTFQGISRVMGPCALPCAEAWALGAWLGPWLRIYHTIHMLNMP
jgi:hypothetical protein